MQSTYSILYVRMVQCMWSTRSVSNVYMVLVGATYSFVRSERLHAPGILSQVSTTDEIRNPPVLDRVVKGGDLFYLINT